MQSPCLHFLQTFTLKSNMAFHSTSTSQNLSFLFDLRKPEAKTPVVKCDITPHHLQQNSRSLGEVRTKASKDNVWSVDNDMEKAAALREKERAKQRRRRGNRGKWGKKKGGKIMVSGPMLMEVETVLQTQEPVIRPAWNTFISSVSGIWKGVGAVFSPITAKMEPIDVGSQNEELFDCYTISLIKEVPSQSGGQASQIQRKTNWVTLNPYGEVQQSVGSSNGNEEVHKNAKASLSSNLKGAAAMGNSDFYGHESLNFETSDLMEEDVIDNEPGLVFFEDGSYSRGPVDIPVMELDESKYYLSPTFLFEQCLVKGCHKRLRIVHTIEFNDGGSDIQIMRVAVYEEQWVSPANIGDISDSEFDIKPFSQRKRMQPSELTGSWKVFEISATPVFGDKMVTEEATDMSTDTSIGTSYVYLCNEALKKRSSPESATYFGEEELLDMQDVTILWLPGGVTSYVDVKKDGVLCIGVGWYSDEGINLVMERDYGTDGKLREVRWKSEVKRRWPQATPL